MKTAAKNLSSGIAMALLFSVIIACGGIKSGPQWTKARKIAGREQKLSTISNIAVDEKFAYIVVGGTVADENEGTTGLRKVDIAAGEVTVLDDGKRSPQSERGGLVADEKYLYWKGGASILRMPKSGGTAEVVASENVGIGIDLAVDNDRVYWVNHGYYSPGTPNVPKPVYSASKSGGKVEIVADQQNAPHDIVVDNENVYWATPTSIVKKAKTGGEAQVVFQASDKEGVDSLSIYKNDLYFAFRADGSSRWSLARVAKTGGEKTILAKTYSTKQIAFDEKNVYFFDEDSINYDVLCRMAIGGGDIERLDVGYAGGAMAIANSQVIYAVGGDLYSFSK